jgi:hypothetical protein
MLRKLLPMVGNCLPLSPLALLQLCCLIFQLMSKLWWIKTLFIDLLGLDFTRHCATISPVMGRCFKNFHHGMMGAIVGRYNCNLQINFFVQIFLKWISSHRGMIPFIVAQCAMSWFSSIFALFCIISSTLTSSHQVT